MRKFDNEKMERLHCEKYGRKDRGGPVELRSIGVKE